MSQTGNYGYTLPKGQAGELVDLGPHRVDSFAAEAAISFGQGVTRGTDGEKQCQAIDASSDTFLGVALFKHTKEQGFSAASSPSSTGAAYAAGDTVEVLREGRCYVTGVGAINAGDDAYVNTSGTFQAGAIDSSSEPLVGPIGKFQSDVTAGGLVILDVIREYRSAA